MGAFDLVLLETRPVLPQVDALQPVPHVVLVPQVQGLLVEGPEGQQRGAQAGGVAGRRGRRAGAGAGAPHDKAHLLGLVGQAEAGGLQDGVGRRGRRCGQAEAGEAPEGVAPVGRARAQGAAGDGVAAAGPDGVGGGVASLGDGMELS